MLSFCGIDVSKDRLDVMVLPGQQSFAVRNDAAGWAELIARLRGFAIAAIGLEGCDNILHDDAIAALARDGALFWPSRQASSLLGSSSRERPLHGPP